MVDEEPLWHAGLSWGDCRTAFVKWCCPLVIMCHAFKSGVAIRPVEGGGILVWVEKKRACQGLVKGLSRALSRACQGLVKGYAKGSVKASSRALSRALSRACQGLVKGL